MTLNEFNRTLLSTNGENIGKFVQKYIFHGVPFVFKGREEDYFDFRNNIADNFNIGFHEVFIIGSAKQGFSYYKNRKGFNYESDVDIAIVSADLYETFRRTIRDFQYKVQSGLATMTDQEKKSYSRLLKWLANGWIRPDLTPFIFDEHSGWDEYFQSISNGKSGVGNYEVHAGVFKSYEDLETYHAQGVYNHYMKLKITHEESSL